MSAQEASPQEWTTSKDGLACTDTISFLDDRLVFLPSGQVAPGPLPWGWGVMTSGCIVVLKLFMKPPFLVMQVDHSREALKGCLIKIETCPSQAMTKGK